MDDLKEFHQELEQFLDSQIKKVKGKNNDPTTKRGQVYLASRSILAEYCHFVTLFSNLHEDQDEHEEETKEKNKFIRAKLINWMLAHPRDSSIQSLKAVEGLWNSAPENPKNHDVKN